MTFWDGHRWVPDAPAPAAPSIRPVRRIAGAAIEGGLITLLLFGLIAGSVFAGRPISSVWVQEVVVSGGNLHLGDGFTVGYASSVREPWGLARCYANDSTTHAGTHPDGSIWGATFSLYPDSPSPQAYVLGESVHPLWLAGGADCVVQLVKYSPDLSRSTVLASTTFVVVP